MSLRRGSLRFSPLFTAAEIGLPDHPSVEHVVKVFLTIGEGTVARWIEMPKGILLLQVVPGQPASGAIYLYDRERQVFFFIDFADGRDDDVTTDEFDQLVAEYDLISWAANPVYLAATVLTSAAA